MALDSQFRDLLDTLAVAGALPLIRGTVEETRAHYRALALARRGEGFVPEPVAAVEDRTVPGPAGPIPVRIYHPMHGRGAAVTYLHGGGWVIGDLDTHDPVCRRVANAVGAVVVSVDYRLAPEHPHPAPLDDAMAALAWTADVFGDRILGVAGDSAGASLAAGVALRAREEGPALAGQLLLYPATDPSMALPSITENGEGYFLTRADMQWFYAQYAPDGAATDPALDLLHADVTGVAPAVVATAEFDPLRDDGDAYAERLRAAAVPVVHLPGPGLIHGYVAFLGAVEAADARSADALAAFAGLLGRHAPGARTGDLRG
ncbi:alpha/beta hydrolase [Pseudonocardia acidicola]|uniref:Alpha/beta hydrolase n=1 Tax=Pseudonocardia acidicola TaxID=2724939 RepID=A0ABX1SB47_9PSEU|nr:alpha/beta hydrolase [Pseudonocardia acidicola]NMH97713.1 alpha/beta hydrolase [Pseudonocardia acidicola]